MYPAAKVSKKNGQKFLSLRIKPKVEQQQRRSVEDTIVSDASAGC
jgi:hypothetical protein